MGRLCGGAHKISALRPHFFSMVGGWRVLGVEGGGWWWVMGWVGGGVGGVVGSLGGGVVGPYDTPPSWGCQMPPMLFFDNLVKKLDQIVKK